MDFAPGMRVRLKSTGEVGVVVKAGIGPIVQIFMNESMHKVHGGDLEMLPGEPDELLVSGQAAGAEEYGLRVQGLFLKHAYRFDELSGLGNARVEPQLHQVFVAHRVLSKMRPRMILADEVGLGKTIEAGLILKELRARGLVDRVLVICPANLQIQWKQELGSKFNEHFEVMTSPALKHFGLSQDNPFNAVPSAIVSQHLLMQSETRRDEVLEAEWDLVIFDEGHRVRRTASHTTRLYDLAHDLRNLSLGLLILTATPMQLDPYELWSLIELVEPGMYASYRQYDQARQAMPWLNSAMLKLRKWPALSDQERVAAWNGPIGAAVAEIADPLMGIKSPEDLDDADTRNYLANQLVEAHPLADVMVRNRKSEIGGFAKRRATRIPVQLRPDELAAYEAVNDYLRYGYNLASSTGNAAMGFLMSSYHKMLTSSSAAIAGSLTRRRDKLVQRAKQIEDAEKVSAPMSHGDLNAALEEFEDSDQVEHLFDLEVYEDPTLRLAGIRHEVILLEDLLRQLTPLDDSKVQRLVDEAKELFARDPEEKLLVFTQFLETQGDLARKLEAAGLRVATFNGKQSLHEKEMAVQRFRDDAQVLVSTEAGGEGRNLQFCHLLVNFDLPWNPMKVEQRIGRVDRIGQKRDVHVYNFFNADTQEERVLNVLEHRIKLFEESVGSLDPILGEVEDDLRRLLAEALEQRSNDGLDAWEKTLQQEMASAGLKEESFADFVLDAASLRHDRAKALLAKHDPMAKAEDLKRFVRDSLLFQGGEVADQEDGSVSLLMPPSVVAAVGKEAAGGAVRGVFDPVIAMQHDELPFLAFGHPIVDKLVELPVSNETAVATVQERDDVPAGIWVESIFEVDSNSLRRTGRFFRVLVGEDGSVQCDHITRVPTLGRDIDLQVPSWVEKALVQASEAAVEVLEDVRDETAERDAEHRKELLKRELAVHKHTVSQVHQQIQVQMASIRELESSGTDQQLKIVPAMRGRIAKRREHIETLEQKHAERVDVINADTSSPSMVLLAASVVRGVA